MRDKYSNALLIINQGTLFMAGGYNKEYKADAWIYDPKKEAWSRKASMLRARRGHTCGLVNNEDGTRFNTAVFLYF